jgi:hypothetical protein
MRSNSAWLLEHESNVYSQAGEDGIIEKILELIPDKDKWCVEFGAWDGIYLSNVRHLIESSDYAAVLIEGNNEKYQELRKNYSDNKKIFTLNKFVGFSEADNLGGLLRETPIPRHFDFLSIDVDGNDYHIWKALVEYEPKVVAIEYNQTIPTEVSFVQEANPAVSQGASLLALVELAEEKGYELICVLPFNAFFVRREYFHLFKIEDNSPSVLRKSLSDITYLFSGYDGEIILKGSRQLPWHGLILKQSRLQVLPKMLHKFPCNYTRSERLLWYIYIGLQRMSDDPVGALKKILRRLLTKDK